YFASHFIQKIKTIFLNEVKIKGKTNPSGHLILLSIVSLEYQTVFALAVDTTVRSSLAIAQPKCSIKNLQKLMMLQLFEMVTVCFLWNLDYGSSISSRHQLRK
ncbi:hypothetical protein ACJX0J_015176, partial [Zea mays]